MTTRGEINSNFYQIVNVDANGAPTSVKPEYLPNIGNANYAANAGHANIADVANSVSVANVAGIGNIATINKDGSSSHVLYGNGTWANVPTISNVANANYANYAGNAFNVNVANVAGIGNIATVNLTGSTSNVLYGNGTFGPISATVANYANYAGNAFSVSGSNVSGQVANANFASYSNISNSANSVAVGNVSGIGNIATVNLTGSSSNVLYGNGVFASIPTVSNVANANYANYAGTAYSVNAGNIVGTVNLANYATVANSVTGSNVSGYVANATHSNISDSANSVAVANVSGIGNIATVNLTGSTSNVLYGNGTFAAIPTVSNVANANYANFAGTAYSVSAGNIVGTVNLANYATVANSVAVANVSGIGNIATVNLTGSSSNVLYGNGVFAAIPSVSNVANANYANYAGNAFSVDAGNIVGTINLANYATVANSVAGSNVSGYVANATHSNVSDSANSVAVANVTGIGNIATTNYDGNGSHVLYGNGAWANIPTVSNVANANYANFAGNAFSVSGSNVSGYVANATHSNVSDSANSVAVGNVSGIGNIATVNLTGNSAQILYGNGTFTSIGTVANATAANSILSNTTTTSTYSILASNSANGWSTPFKSTGVQINFSSNTVSATNFDGDLIASGAPTTLVHVGSGSILANIVGNTIQTITSGNVTYSKPILVNGSVTANTFVSNIATGTAPFTVTSTTTVANLSVASATIASTANSVAVANVTGIGNIATINLTGSTSNVLYGNGVFAPVSVTSVANANYANYAGNAFSVSASNIVGTVNLANFATTANSVAGANVSGTVANATYAVTAGTANSVAVANVTGIGNIATINLDGNVSNVLSGNGSFVALPTVSANANYANYAGNAFSVDAGNIVGTVNLSNYATVANSVAVGNVSGIGNIATVNLTGSTSNVLYGNGTFAAIPTVTSVANANYANFSGNATIANTANSVSVANVSGIGNIATLNLDGSTSNVLYGNGTFAAVVAANATAANTILSNTSTSIAYPLFSTSSANGFAGTFKNSSIVANLGNGYFSATTLYGSNVSGITANLSGQIISTLATGNAPFVVTSTTLVSNLFVEKSSTIQYVNDSATNTAFPMAFVGTSSNTIRADSSGANYNPSTGNLAVSGFIGRFYGAANTVTTAAQPNITSLTASSIQIGNATSNAVFANGVVTTTGNITAPFFLGNGSQLTGITSANATAANTILSNTATTTLVYPLFTSSSANGWTTPQKVTGITANLTANSITATTFVGALTGTATSATSATNASAVLSNTSTVTTAYPMFTTSSANGNVGTFKTTGISANLGNNAITATTFIGNLSGNVPVANVTGIGNIATINIDGNSSNLLYGNGTFAPISITSVANANFANFAGNVTVAAQSNITSLGTLTSLSVTANANVGNLNSNGKVIGTDNFIINSSGGEGGQLVLAFTGVSGVTGQANSTWNTDVDSSNNYRIFSQSATGVTTVTMTGYSGNNNALFGNAVIATGNLSGGNISTAGLANLSNVQLKIYEETVVASANTSTSISPDVSTGTIFNYTANANFTFNGLTNAVAGTSATVIITQDGTGNRTLSSTMKFAGNSKTLSTAASSVDIVCVFYDGTTYYASLTKGYA